MRAIVRSAGMTTPVGLGSRPTAAAVRANLGRLRELPVHDRGSEPIVTARLDEGELPPLHHAAAALGTSSAREVRLLRLAGPALAEAVSPFATGAAWPVFVAVPEALPHLADPVPPDFLNRLSIQASVPVHPTESRVFREGRAGGMHALAAALDALAAGRARAAVVGGVDSYHDLPLLQALIDEGRVQTSTPRDRMFPGEGAAFLVLTRPGEDGGLRRADEPGGGAAPPPLPALGAVHSVGLGFESGHLYSSEPYRGDGLAAAFAALFSGLPAAAATDGARALPPIRTAYAGFNGESFWAKEWGVALVRHRERFAERLHVEHPAEHHGDAGAATGPLLLGLASIGLSLGYRRDPCIVFCSSDRGERGAALIRRPGPG